MAFSESENFYRYLFDAAPDVTMLVDAEGMIEVVNSRFQDVLGYTVSGGIRVQDLLPDERRSAFEVILTGVAEGTTMPEAEVEVVAQSGRFIPMMLDVRQAGNEDGHFLLRLRDLREIKVLEQEYRNLFEGIANAVFIGDPESGQIYQVNRQACELTGHGAGEIIGGDYDEIHDVAWETILAEIEEAGTEELGGYETQLTTKDGESVPVEIHIRIVPRGEDFLYIESAVDISERKALQERVQELRNEWDAFIRHELRSPLTPILAFSQILMEDYPDVQQNPKVMQYLDAIWQGGKRLERLLDLTREISQYEQGEVLLHRFDVDVIQTVRDSIQDAALGVGEEDGGDASRIKMNLAEGLDDELTISHDPQKVQRVVANLVKNALEHDPGEVTVTVSLDNDLVLVSVHNWGDPIPEDRVRTIFEKFNTTKRNKKGTGLGTTIAKLFVEAHNGTIWATSSEEDGTTFAFSLPKTLPEAPND